MAVLAALLLPASAFAQSGGVQADKFQNRICGVNPNRTLFRNEKFVETVLFYLNHIPRNQTPLADFVTTFKSKADRAKEVKQFVDTNYAYLRNMDDVAAMIGDRLIQKKLSWLGVEKTADEVGPEYEAQLFKNAVAVEALLKKDKVKPKEIKNYLLLQMGPIYHSRWKNEQLRKTTIVATLDDTTMRMKTKAYDESKDAKATALLQAVPGSGIRTSEMEKIIDISQVSLFSAVKERTPELLALMAKVKKPEAKKLVEDYRIWIEQGVDSLSQRDELVAKAILAQKGPGLLLLSANFGAGVSEQLMNSCPNQTSSLAPKKKPPGK